MMSWAVVIAFMILTMIGDDNDDDDVDDDDICDINYVEQ